jgi:hypothetical protein
MDHYSQLEKIRLQSIQTRTQALLREQQSAYQQVKFSPGAAAGASGSGGGRQAAGYVVAGYVDQGYFGFN